MARTEVIVFNGVKFYRYPDAKQWAHRSYFKPHVGDAKRGVNALHVEIWRATYGDVPPGHHVHHRDENPLNNDIGNLECLPHSAHASLHGQTRTDAERAHLAEILSRVRPLAVEWHRSDEGREWHKEHAKVSILTRPKLARTCEYCGAEYWARQSYARFCSTLCKQRERAGVPKHTDTRDCRYCGKAFECRPRSKKLYCNKECAGRQQAGVVSGYGPRVQGCVECGASFESSRPAKYCSRDCRKRASYHRSRARLQPER